MRRGLRGGVRAKRREGRPEGWEARAEGRNGRDEGREGRPEGGGEWRERETGARRKLRKGGGLKRCKEARIQAGKEGRRLSGVRGEWRGG